MASAELASMNEPSWAHTGKISSYPNSNPNPNNNPKKKQKQFHHATAANGRYGNINGGSPVVTQTASDDAYSFNQTSASRNVGSYGGYTTFNIVSYTNFELIELRTRLYSELQQIRDLRVRIDSGQLSIVENPRSLSKPKKLNANKGPISGLVGSSANDLSGDGFDVDPADFECLLKDCGKIVAKLLKHKYGYVFKSPVDAVALGLHDYHRIVKKPMDLGTVKSNLARNMYSTPVEFADDMRLIFNNALLYNPERDPVNGMANQMLSKFEELFRPIREKFDSIVNQRMVEKMSIERELRQFRVASEHDQLQGSSWNNNGVIHRKPKPKAKSSPVLTPQALSMPGRVQATKMQAHSSASTTSNPPQKIVNQEQPLLPDTSLLNLPVKEQKVGRAGTVKQPKPRAKDPNKREMTMEEKQKLGIGLQSLPQEKMPQLVHILRKRNGHLAQDGDEIELEIEALDTETLWELDRFVTNWKKMVSKNKRQALIANDVGGFAAADPANHNGDEYEGVASDKNEDDLGNKLKDNDDEDVDIDDDMPVTSFPPIEIEKDEAIRGIVGGGGEEHDNHNSDHDNDRDQFNDGDQGNARNSSSSSGSSSSGSSSSSDSDSGSSSGSDSDADDAHS